MNKFLRFTPVVFYLLFSVFWFYQEYDSLGVIHYPSVAVFLALAVQLFTNNKTTGFLYGILFVVFSGFMLINALTSYLDANVVTDNTIRFFIIQCIIYGVCFLMAIIMVYYNRYYKIESGH